MGSTIFLERAQNIQGNGHHSHVDSVHCLHHPFTVLYPKEGYFKAALIQAGWSISARSRLRLVAVRSSHFWWSLADQNL